MKKTLLIILFLLTTTIYATESNNILDSFLGKKVELTWSKAGGGYKGDITGVVKEVSDTGVVIEQKGKLIYINIQYIILIELL